MFQGSSFGASPSTPFGQSTFGKPATTGFSAPVFGSTGGTSLFGGTTTQPSGGLFGSTAPTPAFGQPQTTQPTFGGGFSTGSPGTGLFGAQQNANTGGGLFGSSTASAFGQGKPAFGSFGTTQQSTGLFGQQPQPQQPQQTSLFGQPSTQSATGLFGNAFGSSGGGGQGGTTVKFTPVTGSDTMVKNGVSTTISTRHHCITCMKEYEAKSLEELRLEDYTANRKGPQQGTQAGGGLFGTPGQTSLFGSANTATSSGFGSGGTSVFGGGAGGSSVFGKPAGTGAPSFGVPASTTANTGFGFGPPNTSLFGANTTQVKPFGAATQGTGMFGATSTPSSGFGTQTTGFGVFGTQQQGSMFSQNKPTFNLSTSTTPGFAFGQTSTTSAAATTPMFGSKPATTGFGTTVTPFGAPATTATAFGTPGFGTTNQNTSLFGTNFQAPAPSFGFGQTSTASTLGSGMTLGGGTSFFGSNAAKPAGSLFGQGTTTGLFGTTGFGTTASPFSSNTTANRGQTTSFNLGTSPAPLMQPGGLGGTSTTPTNNTINQHMLALASMPFGDSPLFKNLLPASGKADELIKPTSPAAQKALISGQNFKISPKSGTKIKVKPISAHAMTKKSLFDGLESEEELHVEVMGGGGGGVVKPSPKRLLLKPRPYVDNKRQAGFAQDSPASLTPTIPHQSPTFSSPSTPRRGQDDLVSNSAGPNGISNKTSPPKKSLEVSLSDNTMCELRPEGEEKVADSTPTTTSPPSPPLQDKEAAAEQSTSSSSGDSELEDTVAGEIEGDCEDHPTGIILRRIGYYTIPPLDELTSLMDNEGHCIVDNFTVGRLNYGNIFYPDSFDVAGLNIDEIVHFRHKEVVVYPEDDLKPEVGEGLNRRAQVTLDRVWPMDKSTRMPISDPSRIACLDYESKLRQASAKHGTRFVEYRPQTGSWVFKVDHFSKYGLSDSDEEEASETPEVKKMKLLNMAGLPIKLPPLPSNYTDKISNGLSNLHPTSHLLLGEEDEDMEDGINTPFDLDDELERGVALSPTSKLAKQIGTSSHKLQLMKASFFEEEDYNIGRDYIDYEDMNGYMNELGAGIFEADKVHNLSSLYRNPTAFMPPPPQPQPHISVPQPEEMVEDFIEESEGEEGLGDGEVARPVQLALKYRNAGLAWKDSTAASLDAGCLADMAVFRGVSMRANWAVGSQLSVLATAKASAQLEGQEVRPLSQLHDVLQGRQHGDDSHNLLQSIRIKGGLHLESLFSFQESIEAQLEVALSESRLSVDEDGVPGIAAKSGVSGLHKHCAVADAMASSASADATVKLYQQVWSLCLALWGTLPECDAEDSHGCVMGRREQVSEWLTCVVSESVARDLSLSAEDSSAVFALMTGFNIAEACSMAQQAGDHQLSVLLCQSGSGEHVRSLIRRQLSEWKETQADKHIDTDRLKGYMLVAGLTLHNTTDALLNVCLGIDWIRAFAIHLWYICPLSASVTDALLIYEAAFNGDNSYAVAPLPQYCADYSVHSSAGSSVYDVLFHLLKLFSFKTHPLEKLLNPSTHTPDPLDYRLSWLLMRVLGSLGYSHLSEHSSSIVHSSFASQLESHGLWHWAVFVLLHLPEPASRETVVLDMIARHITLDDECEKENFLKESLRIPHIWIYDAKATKAISENKYHEAAKYLINSENWNLGHSIIMEHIFPKAIINEKYEYLEGLLKEFETDERHKEVFGWSSGGGVILEYLAIVGEVAEIVGRQDMNVATHLHRLEPQLTELCMRIKLLPTPSPLHRLSQAEMAKRCSGLVQSLVTVANEATKSHVNALSQLVSQLPLPSDYGQQEWQGVLSSWSGFATSS